jgi:hypothetical protein
MTRHPYLPHAHDPVLTELNQTRRLTDQEIADEMGFDRHTVYKHRVRLGLPAYSRPRPVGRPMERGLPAPKERPNPVAVAQHTLGARLEERSAGYFLDRVPVSLDTLMKEANRVRARKGLEQVGVEKWWV